MRDAIQSRRHPLPGRPGQPLRDLERLENQYWPADYFIDANGRGPHYQFGEGDYAKDEALVRELLTPPGPPLAGADDRPRADCLGLRGSHETYLNPQRRYSGRTFAQPLNRSRTPTRRPQPSARPMGARRPLEGGFPVDNAIGATATISGGVQARDVYLVRPR